MKLILDRMVQDIRPPMKAQHLQYLQCLHGVPEKLCTLWLCPESGFSRSSIRLILEANKRHPYKLYIAQHLGEKDWRIQLCISQSEQDTNFLTKIFFLMKQIFASVEKLVGNAYVIRVITTLSGWVGRVCKMPVMMVWVEMRIWRIIESICLLKFVKILMQKEITCWGKKCFIPPTPHPRKKQKSNSRLLPTRWSFTHFGHQVLQYLNQQFLNAWISPVGRPPKKPLLSSDPLSPFLWWYSNATVH